MIRSSGRGFLLVLLAAACGGEKVLGPVERLPRPLTVAEQNVIQSGTAFGLQLFQAVYADESQAQNVFISPFSAHMALGMTMNGASGETFDSMRQTLGFGGLQETEINASYRELTPMLLGLDPRVELAIANSMWYRQGFAVKPTFVDALQRNFDAEVRGLDFSAPSAPATINAWVRDKTRGRIPDIVDRIADETVMYLINAVWFKAKWTVPFDARETRPGTFRRRDGSRVEARFMNRTGVMPYLSTALFDAVDLPYGGGAWRMTVLVPREPGGTDAVVSALTPARWRDWVAGFTEQRVAVSLPRFKLQYEKQLAEPLKAMGMGVAFSQSRASFDRIADGPRLYISAVKQKTFVEVNEEGTEASAATSVEVGIVSAPPAVVADRPFVVVIRERLSGTVLFIGVIGDPTAA